MQLTWSHAAIQAADLDAMLAFYTDVLGFRITDRGPLAPGGPEIVFLSQSADEHHQIAMIGAREGDPGARALHHFAFRTPAFADLGDLHGRLAPLDGIPVMPLSHGNTLSLYFNDPEGNGIEVFWDTPWHVAQPQGAPWDPSLDETAALAWVREQFGAEPGFEPRQDYYARRRAAAVAETGTATNAR